MTEDDRRAEADLFNRRVRLLAIIAQLSDAVRAGQRLAPVELDAVADLCDAADMPEDAALVRSWIPEATRAWWFSRSVERIM